MSDSGSVAVPVPPDDGSPDTVASGAAGQALNSDFENALAAVAPAPTAVNSDEDEEDEEHRRQQEELSEAETQDATQLAVQLKIPSLPIELYRAIFLEYSRTIDYGHPVYMKDLTLISKAVSVYVSHALDCADTRPYSCIQSDRGCCTSLPASFRCMPRLHSCKAFTEILNWPPLSASCKLYYR